MSVHLFLATLEENLCNVCTKYETRARSWKGNS